MPPSAKKRKLANASRVEEVSFDDAARHEFLTGFHKRKLQRARHAQEIAEKRAKEEKRQERKKIREERTAEFERALQEHRRQLKILNRENSDESNSEDSNSGSGNEEEENEWEGFAEPPAVDYEAEYIDEDKYTTVTVEEMDPSREALYRSEMADGRSSSDEEGEGERGAPKTKHARDPTATGSGGTKSEEAKVKKSKFAKSDKPKKKKRKFRYEGKEERRATKMKERLGNRKKAQARRER